MSDVRISGVGPLISKDEEQIKALESCIEEFGLTEGIDRLIWIPGNGNFTSKIFTKLYASQSRPPGIICGEWNLIWSSKLPQKIKLFFWKLHWSVLPTRKFFFLRILNLSLKCAWCDRFVETINHLFWNCEIVAWAWNYIGN